MALWLTSDKGGAMSQAELAKFFQHSSGWVCHIVKGRWRAIRLTNEQARLMSIIYLHERRRRGWLREVRERGDRLNRMHGELMREMEEYLGILRKIKVTR